MVWLLPGFLSTRIQRVALRRRHTQGASDCDRTFHGLRWSAARGWRAGAADGQQSHTGRARHKPSRRVAALTDIGVERMGDAADLLSDPRVLRLENLDTDLAPPAEALVGDRACRPRRRRQQLPAVLWPQRPAPCGDRPGDAPGRAAARDLRLAPPMFHQRGRAERRVQRAAGVHRPGRRGRADKPDLCRPDQPCAPGRRRAAIRAAACRARRAGASIFRRCATRSARARVALPDDEPVDAHRRRVRRRRVGCRVRGLRPRPTPG